MSRGRKWTFAAVVVIGALAVAVVLGEVGLRLFFPQPMGVWHQDRDGLAVHWPGLVTYLPQFGLTVSFNSTGMRGREPAVRKPVGAFRVLVLGDSFMEALQVPFEASFPSRLEREIERRTGRRLDVVNASVSGWGTDDELKYLATRGVKWQPDLVLVAMTLHNDISDNLRQRFHTLADGALVERPREAASFVGYKVIELKGFLATRSHAYQLWTRARRGREQQGEARQLGSHVVELFREPAGAQVARGLELTAALLERMRLIASAEGSRLAVVLLPLAMQLSDEWFAEFVQAAPQAPVTPAIDRPQRLLAGVAGRLGIEVIDLLPGFRAWTAEGGGALYLERDGHWNPGGHRLAAETVARELVDRQLVPAVSAEPS